MAEPHPRVKRWTPKTRTGCRTCRLRRVKCDEARPVCKKCSSGSRECGGYEVGPGRTATINQQTLLPRQKAATLQITPTNVLPSLPSVLTSAELAAFDYFRTHVVRTLSGQFSSAVWAKHALQVSHQQAPALHAAVAFGSLYLAKSALIHFSRSEVVVNEPYQLALRHYGLAMARLRTFIETAASSENPMKVANTVIMCCLLFVCFEMLQGDQSAVLFHLVKSLKIMHETCGPKNGATSAKRLVVLQPEVKTVSDHLHDVFVRLDVDSTMFGRRQPFLHPTAAEVGCHIPYDTVPVFSSLEAAKTHLDRLTSLAFEIRGELLRIPERKMGQVKFNSDLVRSYCVVSAKARRIDIEAIPHLAVGKRELLEAFKCRHTAVKLMYPDLKPVDLSNWLVIQIQYFHPCYVLATFQDTTEQLCDEYLDDFDQVLDLVQQYRAMLDSQPGEFTFKLEPEILGPLYLIATKCRRRSTRRKAIEFLQNAIAQEGLWNGPLYAAFAEKFMELEEQETRRLFNTTGVIEHIPPAARFCDMLPQSIPTGTGYTKIVCGRYKDGGTGELEIVEKHFKLEIPQRACAAVAKGESCIRLQPSAWELLPK